MNAPAYASVAKWVEHKKVTELNGMTYDQMKMYRRNGDWLEERQWRYTPKRRVVYNIQAIDEWCEGKI